MEGKILQDHEMPGVRTGQGDVFDEGDLALDDVLGAVFLVAAPVGDGDGELVALFEEDEGWHGEEPVQGAGEVAEIGARTGLAVGRRSEVEGEKEIGFDGAGGEIGGIGRDEFERLEVASHVEGEEAED